MTGYFDRATTGLIGVRKQVKIVAIITRLLVDDLEELIRFCRDRGYEFDLNLPSGFEELWPSAYDTDRIVEILSKHNVWQEPVLEHAAEYLKTRRIRARHCLNGYVQVVVEPDGTVRPGCYSAASVVGNINEQSLEEMMHAPAYRAAIRRMYQRRVAGCAQCVCGGVSLVYSNPVATFGYVARRLKGTRLS